MNNFIIFLIVWVFVTIGLFAALVIRQQLSEVSKKPTMVYLVEYSDGRKFTYTLKTTAFREVRSEYIRYADGNQATVEEKKEMIDNLAMYLEIPEFVKIEPIYFYDF